jgi:glycosyltransferase involved in cell wall biosynthesis
LNQRLPKRSRIPCVATFHDLFVMSAEYSSPEFRLRFEEQARHAAAHSARIIAVSRFTAGQVEALLGYPATQIRVVPHGVDLPVQTKPIAGRKPAVLSVGAVQKRKNTKRLIEAFAALPPPWELWLAGSLGYEAEAMLAEARQNERIRLLGYVPDAQLERLYGEASIFAFPSLDEGFGIPVLEAMAHGLPVLSSNCSALPEVAGEAALLVDPLQVEAIAAGLLRLSDGAEQERYAKAGLERVKEFSWSRAARETVAVYEEVLGPLA